MLMVDISIVIFQLFIPVVFLPLPLHWLRSGFQGAIDTASS